MEVVVLIAFLVLLLLTVVVGVGTMEPIQLLVAVLVVVLDTTPEPALLEPLIRVTLEVILLGPGLLDMVALEVVALEPLVEIPVLPMAARAAMVLPQP